MSETLGLKNINLLTKEQFDAIAEPTNEELWVVEVETYHDNKGNWYRIYPDGWCEQGGVSAAGTVNLLKPYRDSLYRVDLSPNSSTHSYTSNRTATSFTISGGNCDWVTRGYIA